MPGFSWLLVCFFFLSSNLCVFASWKRCLPVSTWVTKIFCGAGDMGIASGIIITWSIREKVRVTLWLTFSGKAREGCYSSQALYFALPTPTSKSPEWAPQCLPEKPWKINPLRWCSGVFKMVLEARCHICLLYFMLSGKCRSPGYFLSRSRRAKAFNRKQSSLIPPSPGAGDEEKRFSLEIITTKTHCTNRPDRWFLCGFSQASAHTRKAQVFWQEWGALTTTIACPVAFLCRAENAPSATRCLLVCIHPYKGTRLYPVWGTRVSGTSFVPLPLWPVQGSCCSALPAHKETLEFCWSREVLCRFNWWGPKPPQWSPRFSHKRSQVKNLQTLKV